MLSNDTKAERLCDKLFSTRVLETDTYGQTKVYNAIMGMAEWKDEEVAQFLRDKHFQSLSMPDSEIRRKVIEEIYTELFETYFPSPR